MPRSLVALILGVTIIPLALLAWFGYRLVQQDRVIEDRQLRERAKQVADTIVATLQRATFASQQRLASGVAAWPDGAVVVAFTGTYSEAHPRDRIAYLPSILPLREASAATLAHIDEIEFRQHSSAASIRYFRGLANAPDLAIRAAGLLRLGRTLEAVGQIHQAMAAYSQLSTMDSVAVADTPASLAGAYARCRLLERQKRFPELQKEGRRIVIDLHSGRWNLTAPLYWLYVRDATKWGGTDLGDSPDQSEIFARAAETLWQNRNSLPPSGQESLRIGNQALKPLANPLGFAILQATPLQLPLPREAQWLRLMPKSVYF